MYQSTKSPTQLNSHLRVVRDEDAPPYDAVPSPKMAGGFAMIPARVFDLNDGTALAVFAILAKHANQEGACWPSMKRLEECLGWTDNRIRPALKLLIDSGIVAIEKRKLNGMDQSNLYRISPEVQVSRDRTPVSRSGALGIPSGGVGYPATGHELKPIELNTRELYTPPTPSRGKRESNPKKPIPENLAELIPPATWSKIAAEQAMTDDDLHRETEKMIDFYQGKGEKRPDWVASWRTWMRSPYRKPAPRQSSPAPVKPAAPSLHPELKRRLDGWMAESAEIGREPFPLPTKLQTDIDNWQKAQQIGAMT